MVACHLKPGPACVIYVTLGLCPSLCASGNADM